MQESTNTLAQLLREFGFEREANRLLDAPNSAERLWALSAIASKLGLLQSEYDAPEKAEWARQAAYSGSMSAARSGGPEAEWGSEWRARRSSEQVGEQMYAEAGGKARAYQGPAIETVRVAKKVCDDIGNAIWADFNNNYQDVTLPQNLALSTKW